MSWVADSIVGGIDWDTSSFTGGFLKVEALTQTFPAIVTQYMASPMLGLIGTASLAMQGIVGAIRSGIGFIIDAVDQSAEQADKVGDLATNIGVSAEQLSGLGLVAKQAGAGLEAVADGFKFLGRNQAEALQGNKDLVAEFARLNIQLTDSAGNARPLNDLMFELADAIAGIESPGERTRIAMALLGRSGTELIATLSQGSSAIREQIDRFRDYGAVVTDQAAKSGDAFQDLRGEVAIAWEGIKNQLGEPLRESLTPLLQDLLSWLRTHQPEVKDFMRDLSRNVIEAIEAIVNAVANLKNELIGLGIGGALGAIGGGIAGGLLGGPAGVIPGIYLGGAIGGAAGGAAAYAAAPNVNLNYRPQMSDSQVGRVVREVVEQADASRRAAIDREAREQRIRNGI